MDSDVLRRAGIESADAVVIATDGDNTNIVVAQAAGRVMKDQAPDGKGVRGAIVNTGSTSGHRGIRNKLAYAAAKGGVNNLTRAGAGSTLILQSSGAGTLGSVGVDPSNS